MSCIVNHAVFYILMSAIPCAKCVDYWQIQIDELKSHLVYDVSAVFVI